MAPSPAYSLSSYSTDPSPLHSSFSPGPSSSSDTCSSNSSQIPPGAPAQVGLTSVSQALSGAGAVLSGAGAALSGAGGVSVPGVKIGDVVETHQEDVVVHSSSGKSYRYPSNIVPSKSVPGSSGKTNLRRHTASGSGVSRDVNIVPSKSLPGSGPQSAGNVTKRKISESSVSSSPKAHRKTGSQVCRVIPVSPNVRISVFLYFCMLVLIKSIIFSV